MSRNSKLRVESYTHEPKYMGRDVGRPCVKLTLGTEENFEVSSMISIFENNNWSRRLRKSSFLVLRGHRPLSPPNHEALESLLYNASPRYCEAYVSGFHEPPREIRTDIDSYLVDLKELEAEYDALDYYARQSGNFNGANFAIRYHGIRKTEENVRELTSNNKIYPHDVYLYVEEIDGYPNWQKNYEEATKMAARNGWNVVPPYEKAMEVLNEDDEDGEDDE